VLSISLTIDADVTDFGAAAALHLRTRLAAHIGFGLTAADILLTVSSGSTIVNVAVIMPTVAAAHSAAITLGAETPASLTTVLGVPLTHLSAPALTFETFALPLPPPPSSPRPSELIDSPGTGAEALSGGWEHLLDSVGAAGITGAGIGIVCILACPCVVLFALYRRRRKRGSSTREGAFLSIERPEAHAPASTSPSPRRHARGSAISLDLIFGRSGAASGAGAGAAPPPPPPRGTKSPMEEMAQISTTSAATGAPSDVVVVHDHESLPAPSKPPPPPPERPPDATTMI
jgi:hypothetical protein